MYYYHPNNMILFLSETNIGLIDRVCLAWALHQRILLERHTPIGRITMGNELLSIMFFTSHLSEPGG